MCCKEITKRKKKGVSHRTGDRQVGRNKFQENRIFPKVNPLSEILCYSKSKTLENFQINPHHIYSMKRFENKVDANGEPNFLYCGDAGFFGCGAGGGILDHRNLCGSGAGCE